MNVCKVKCGDKEISIRIQRLSFKSVEEAYEKIGRIGQEEAMSEGVKHLNATGNEAEANFIYILILAEKRYEMIGGQAYREFMNNKINLYNTCALRVSYALNYSTHPIKDMEKQNTSRAYKGDDGHIYYLGVLDIVELLNKNWKELTWKKPTYTQVKEKIKCGCSEDFYHNMTSKDENQQFFKELQSIQRKGIVAMRGPNGFNHTILWEIDNFVDVKLGISDNYLLRNDTFIKDLYFWELL